MKQTIKHSDEPLPTLVSEVVQQLREEILSGEFEPGMPLREVALAKRFETSRQTIREALRTLANLGLLELHERRGVRIPQITPRRAKETYTLRALLESYALRTALVDGRIREAEMQEIEEAYRQMAECAHNEDIPGLVEADMHFHWVLCRLCEHELLLDTLQRLQSATRLSLLHMKVYGTDAEGEVESHAPILAAVRKRDAEGAAAALRDHINAHGERLLFKLIELQSSKG
ncbi:GntR family transcriptional regulator [Oricola sp.]|uniref:GntR family transcriptional regulator n=1 Tax=Oricola sp. TaxID=1979950 RepID=UPI0025F4924F|nr:GntR family transcriptional regulator [Oricola sp.]MCI5075244.1 GntR family transcriptional regulator [Oricola sp.]